MLLRITRGTGSLKASRQCDSAQAASEVETHIRFRLASPPEGPRPPVGVHEQRDRENGAEETCEAGRQPASRKMIAHDAIVLFGSRCDDGVAEPRSSSTPRTSKSRKLGPTVHRDRG